MLTRFLLLVAVALAAQSAQAQKAELTFGVSGICGMCEDRIEAAFDQKGIVVADYDLEKKTIHVVYKSKKWSEESLHTLATGVGHDTDKYKATDEQYANIHGCCKYRDSGGGSCTGGDRDDHR
jgi:hypothetical protein